jgi:tetratricopeptide (TPR) repeat protein
MENINIEKEKFDALTNALKKEELKMLTMNNLPDYELKAIIKQLDEIISLAEKNKEFTTIIKLRQFHLDRANSYLHLNDYSAAIKGYEKVKSMLQNDERDFELHRLKCLDGVSWAKARIGNYNESLKDCNELIAYAFPKKLLLSKFFTVRACCYKELGNPILAERNFEFASLNPLFLDRVITEEGDESLPSGFTALGYSLIGTRYFKHGSLRDALINYEKAVEINPSYVKGHFNKGVVLAQSENHSAAIQAYSKAISLDPNYVDAYLNRGNSYCNVYDFKSAISDYDTCLSKDPSNQLAFDNRQVAKSLL